MFSRYAIELLCHNHCIEIIFGHMYSIYVQMCRFMYSIYGKGAGDYSTQLYQNKLYCMSFHGACTPYGLPSKTYHVVLNICGIILLKESPISEHKCLLSALGLQVMRQLETQRMYMVLTVHFPLQHW